jgi:hypothetical protein
VSDLARWKVHGPVRTLEIEQAEWDLAEERWRPPRPGDTVTFLPDGRLSLTEHRNPEGSVARGQCLYDDAGRLAETRFWMNDEPPARVLHSYDPAGRHLRTERVGADGVRRETESCAYDPSGRKTKTSVLPAPPPGAATTYGVEGSEQSYTAPGAVTMTTVYGQNGQPEEVSFRDAQDRVVSRVAFVRDAAGRALREEMFLTPLPFPEIQNKIESAPPGERANAEALLARLFGPSRAFASATYEYDPEGRPLVRTRRLAGLSEERTLFRYDEHGNPIEETFENNRRELSLDKEEIRTVSENSTSQQTRFEYQYDDHGNWTERVVWGRLSPNPDFQRSNTERRVITYHPAAAS